MAETVKILEAFLAHLDKFGTASLPVLTHTSQLLTTWIEDASGTWTKGKNDYSGCLPVEVKMNDFLVSRVAALKVKKALFLEKVFAFRVRICYPFFSPLDGYTM